MRRIYAWLASVIGAIIGVFAFFAYSKGKGKKEAKNEANEEYIETRKRMDGGGAFNDAVSARDYVQKRRKR